MQVMFVTVTVPLGVTLYASCVGHFSMFTSAQLPLSVTHCCSTVPVLYRIAPGRLTLVAGATYYSEVPQRAACRPTQRIVGK